MTTSRRFERATLHWLRLALGAVLIFQRAEADAPPAAIPMTEQHVVRNWTTADGLPDNTVRAVVGSRDGYLWVGTAAGIARFDGVRFVVPGCTNSDVPATDSVGHLYEDRQGRLWITSRRGLGTLDGQHYRRLEADPLNPRLSGARLTEDAAGNLWIAAGPLYRWVDGRLELFKTAEGKPVEDVVDLCLGTRGELWVLTFTGLWHDIGGTLTKVYHGSRLTLIRSAGPDQVWTLNGTGHLLRWVGNDWVEAPYFGELTRTLIQRRNGDLWVGAYDSGRLWRVRNGVRLTLGREDGIAGNSVICFHEDEESNLWVGVNGRGLFQVRERRLDLFDEQHGFPLPFLSSVAEDSSGQLFAGVMRNGEYRMVSNRFEHLSYGDQGSDRFLSTAMVPAAEGGMWMGKIYGAVRRVVGTNVVQSLGAEAGTRSLLVDRDGSLWRGTRLAGLEHFTPAATNRYTAPEQLPSNDVLCLAQDRSGAIWAGTAMGLCRIHEGRSTRYGMAQGLGSEYIRSLHVDSDGVLWVGTMDGGLGGLVDGRFIMLTAKDGLPDDRVVQILEDDFRQLWLGTRAGLMRIALDDLHRAVRGERTYLHGTLLGAEEGLRWPDCGSEYHPSCTKTRNGRLWFSTVAGLIAVDPQRFTNSATAPRVHIEEFTVNGETRQVVGDLKAPLRIGPNPERVEIRFTGLSFAAPTKLRFRFQLENYDRNVVEAGRRRVALYSRLKPGRYRFRVTAGNNDGVWSPQGDALEFEVLPAFWQTWPFRGFTGLVAAGGVFVVFRLRVRHILERQREQAEFARQVIDSQEQERKRIAIELHDGLGQNLLLAVNRAALGARESSDAETARNRLRDIEALLRDSIQEVRTVSQNLRPAHLEKIGLCKSLEAMVRQVENSSGLKFNARIEPVDHLVPPEAAIQVFRVVQEALNNVIKHSHASTVWVTVEPTPAGMLVEIRDDGRGFDANARLPARGSAGLGLAGMAERVRLLGGTWECLSTPGAGTTIRMRLKPVAETR